MKKYCYTCMEEIKQGEYCKTCQKTNEADRFVHHLRPGTVLNNKYLIGNCLGEGGFGITYIGLDLTLDIKVAIKEYYPNGYVNRNNDVTQLVTTTTKSQTDFFEQGKERFLQEAKNIAKFIYEPGIVGVREYFECNNTAYIIMDYLDGENLSEYIKHNGKFEAKKIFDLILPIVKSLQKMHSCEIIHRDISPDNIMYLKNGSLKLMDFGSARYFTNNEKKMSVLLKKGYAPEEQYRSNGDQGPWTDVYGLCATLYKCITGKTPEDALDRLVSDDLKKPSELGIAIEESFETILMYGLAVHKEDRCQSMIELEQLIKKAFNKQKIILDNKTDSRTDEYKTYYADDENKTQAANDIFTQGNNSSSSSGSGTGGRGKKPQRQPETSSQPTLKTVIIVVAVAAVILLAIVFLMFFLLKDDNTSNDQSEDENVAEEVTEFEEDQQNIFTSAATVSMPLCQNKKLSSVKNELEGLGLVVREEYAFDDYVTKDYIISQSVAQGMQVDVGETVILTVSKGSDICPYDYSQKLTVTASSGSSYGTATLYEWYDGDWQEQSFYDCSVGKNGIGVTKEGSSTTPQGLYRLGVVLSSYQVTTNLSTYKATADTCVVDDVNSSKYNCIMNIDQVPSGVSYDNIGKGLTNGTTYATVYIEHNGNGFSDNGVIRGGGSAIGLRGQFGSLSPTYGDVDISSDDMIDLLQRLDYACNPMIEIK